MILKVLETVHHGGQALTCWRVLDTLKSATLGFRKVSQVLGHVYEQDHMYNPGESLHGTYLKLLMIPKVTLLYLEFINSCFGIIKVQLSGLMHCNGCTVHVYYNS